MEKLELKYLKGYLGTGLKMKAAYKSRRMNDIEELCPENITKLMFLNRKPLLIPLSALTEPLEDGSVPIVELAKIEAGNFDEDGFLIGEIGEYRYFTNHAAFNNDAHICIYKSKIGRLKQILNYNCGNGFNSYYCFNEDMSDVELRVLNNQLHLFEYLYSKHFDIHGLIPAGLAIDKRTIK